MRYVTMLAAAAVFLAVLVPASVSAQEDRVIKDSAGNVVLEVVGTADIPELVRLLGDERPDVRAQARAELSGFGYSSVGPLLEALASGDNAYEVITALGEVGDEYAAPAVSGHINDKDPASASAARQALIKMGDKAVPSLVALMPDKSYSGQAAEVLKHIQDPSPESVDEVRGLLDTGDAAVMPDALGVLGVWKDAGLVARIPGLLSSDDPEIRRSALVAYRGVTTDYDMAILTRLLDDPDAVVRASSAELMQYDKDEANVAPLVARFKVEPDGMVRSVILAALGETGGADAKAALLAGLDDPDPNVVGSALWYLDDLKVEGASERIVAMFREDRAVTSDKQVIQESLQTLTNLDEPVDLSVFTKYLDVDQEFTTRKLILGLIAGVGRSGDEDTAEALKEYMAEEKNSVLLDMAKKALDRLQ